MSTLTNLFAADDAGQAPDSTSQPSDEAAIEPGTPGYEPDDPNGDPPPVLMPGGEMDPAA